MNGPDDKTLAHLASLLPSMVEGRVNGHFVPRPGGKLCAGCGAMFGRPTRDGSIKRDVCKSCRKILKAGGTIFICGDNRVYSVMAKEDSKVKINPKYAGRIVLLTTEQMDKLLTPSGET